MSKDYEIVDSIESLKNTLKKVKKAQKEYSKFSQEKVDEIFKAASIAANQARIPLAKLAVEETGMGIVEDKVTKNHFAAEYIYNNNESNIYSNIQNTNCTQNQKWYNNQSTPKSKEINNSGSQNSSRSSC